MKMLRGNCTYFWLRRVSSVLCAISLLIILKKRTHAHFWFVVQFPLKEYLMHKNLLWGFALFHSNHTQSKSNAFACVFFIFNMHDKAWFLISFMFLPSLTFCFCHIMLSILFCFSFCYHLLRLVVCLFCCT